MPPNAPPRSSPSGVAPPATAGASAGPAALVLGLDSHGLAVARALADAGVPVYALKRDLGLPGARTNRVRRIFHVQDYTAEQLLPALRAARQALAAHPEVVLLANNDRQVAVIAEHLPDLLPLYRVAWATGAQTILRLQKKSELEAVARAQGLLYPRSVLFDSTTPPAACAGMQLPLILKPVRPLSSFKTLLIHDLAALPAALQRHAHDLPILGQEYVAGGDESLFFGALTLDRGRVVQALAGQKLASYPPARGQTTVARTVHAPEVIALTEQFFAGMGLSGPVSLELKRDAQGRHWVIEPTVGRTDFWADLCIGAGFNQPLQEFQIALGLPPQAGTALRPCLWFDTERDPLAWLHLAWTQRRMRPAGAVLRFPYAGHHDPRPLRVAAARLLRSRLRSAVGRLMPAGSTRRLPRR